jgi:hypothetical protein
MSTRPGLGGRFVVFIAWIAAVFGTALILALATRAAAPSSQVQAADATQVRLPPTSGAPYPPDPGATAASAAPKGPPPADPADASASKAVLANDQTFQQLLGGIRYRVVSIAPWTNESGDTRLGTVVHLQLLSSLNASTSLPGVRFNPDGTTFVQLMIPVKVTDANTLRVLIDLRTHQVVSAMPPDSALSPVAGTNNVVVATGGSGGS